MDSKYSQADYHFQMKDALLGVQTLFIAMGALVLVPLLTGLDPNVALFTAGTGTLIFQWLTKGKIPVFLGSSFAFVPATIAGIQNWGLPETLCGLAAAGVVYALFAYVVHLKGKKVIEQFLPPLITGPVIMAIGLFLAPVAINLAMGKTGDGSVVLFEQGPALTIAGVSLLATIVTRLFAKGRLKLLPLLVGIATGSLLSWFMGVLDLSALESTSWFAVPQFVFPKFHWPAIFLIFPIAVVSAIEHIGDIIAISAVTERNYLRDPGLHRSLLGDGVATMWASLLGGPPNTTYSEVTAGVALTKVYNPAIMTWACIAAIVLSFIGKAGLIFQAIPTPVMGGILILLFGAIAVTGLNILVMAGQDLMKPRNMTIVGIILIVPVGGLSIGTANFALEGIGLAGIIGVILNTFLPNTEVEPNQA